MRNFLALIANNYGTSKYKSIFARLEQNVGFYTRVFIVSDILKGRVRKSDT